MPSEIQAIGFIEKVAADMLTMINIIDVGVYQETYHLLRYLENALAFCRRILEDV